MRTFIPPVCLPKEKEAKNKQRSCGERPRILANVVYFEECGFSDCGYTTAILGMVDFFLGGECLCRNWGRRREGPRCRRVVGQIETDLARARRGFSRQHMSDIARGIAQNLPGLPPVR